MVTRVGMADFADSFPSRELSVCTRAQYPYPEKKLAALDREFRPRHRWRHGSWRKTLSVLYMKARKC